MVPKQSRSFLISRALIAIALMIGFYLLALAIAGGLAWLPYAEMKYANRIHLKLALFCGLGALAIVWSILPRFDKFTPPGPKLEPHEHPEFFKLLREIAAKTQQAMPAEVYLCPQVNAWVTERGGIMGFGSRRVMGVGLPLLQVFTVSEFSAVLAHEFGHYHGGDTKLGPWIYKTRAMIGRTVSSLGNSVINYLFIWYAKLFLRITHAVSRQQEYLADELAARTVSPQAMIAGLKKVHGASVGFHGYLHGEFAPVFAAKLRTPFVQGFTQYWGSPEITKLVSDYVEKELKDGKGNPYDTHPALNERIGALQTVPAGNEQLDNRLAVTLLSNPERYEMDLLRSLTGEEQINNFKSISWNEVGAEVYVPLWEKGISADHRVLSGETVDDIYGWSVDFENFAQTIMGTNESKTAEDKKRASKNFLGTALVLALHREGWGIQSQLGGAIRATKDGVTLEPFNFVNEIVDGKITRQQWDEKMAAMKHVKLG